MKAVYSPLHLLHDPEHELEASRLQAPFENGRRAEAIRQALAGDPQFELVEPTPWGTAPIEVVHAPGLVRFLETAWEEYQAEFGPTREVIPDVFYNQRMREGMSPGVEPASVGGRLGWWCYETTTPLVAGHVRRRARRRSTWRSPPPTRARRRRAATGCAARPATTRHGRLRRLLLLQQRGDRRPARRRRRPAAR